MLNEKMVKGGNFCGKEGGLLRRLGEKTGVGVIGFDGWRLITEIRRDWREISVNEA